MTTWRVSAGLGPHAAFIKGKVPGWIKHSRVADIKRLKQGLFVHADERD